MCYRPLYQVRTILKQTLKSILQGIMYFTVHSAFKLMWVDRAGGILSANVARISVHVLHCKKEVKSHQIKCAKQHSLFLVCQAHQRRKIA